MSSFSAANKSPLSDTIHSEGIEGEQNVLQRHVSFFDQNHDGIVYPWETFKGFRAIGCGLLLSSFASIFINVGLSRKTRPGKYPSLLFPIEVKNIQKAKHGSDSGVYDTEGRFVHSKFEEIFRKHARSNSDTLTSDELMGMLKANREPKDYAGWVASYTEWKILYILCKDKKGLLHRDTIRAVYDGSLFEQMAKEKASSKQPNRGSYGGIIRSDQGKWVEGFCGYIGYSDSLKAELWGIRHALKLCRDRSWRSVEIETDCLVAINLILKNKEVENHPCRALIDDCKELIQETEAKLSHILREANRCADVLAKLGSEQDDQEVRLLVPPDIVLEEMKCDMRGVAYGRGYR